MDEITGTPIRVLRSKEQSEGSTGWMLVIVAHNNHYHSMVSQCITFEKLQDSIEFIDEFKELLKFADGIEFDDITDESPNSLMPY